MARPSLTLNTNLAEMPWGTMKKMCFYMNSNDQWKIMITGLTGNASFKFESIQAFARQSNPSESVLRELGNRGFQIKDILSLLDKTKLEKPQLLLRRKFLPVSLRRQPRCTKTDDNGSIVIDCIAIGFPYPCYQWKCNGIDISGANSHSLLLTRCSTCTSCGVYTCHIWNEVGSDDEWSAHYRKAGKQFKSEILSDPVCIESADLETGISRCDSCSKERALARLCQMVTDQTDLTTPSSSMKQINHERDICTATDKVALIISNSEYWNLPKLLTPPCDAECLAEGLLSLGFKTVALADLTLTEMKSIIEEYGKLLGSGLYAVFYFVGHGLETQGQCYLLPVDAPGEDYKSSDCVSVDWVLSLMQQQDPSLNLILLDMCRKYPPNNLQDFLSDHKPSYEYRVNRNTVFGYATSCGVGAYEVKGETNGVFMTYLKNYLKVEKPVIEVLNLVLQDLEKDPKAGAVQFPELRTNLSRPRCLTDPMVISGHTVSYDLRTSRWEHIYELPDPIRVTFDQFNLGATIWFDFCGHFTNMIYVFSSVMDLNFTDNDNYSSFAHNHRAYLKFTPDLDLVQTLVCQDHEEGISLRSLLKNLQKVKGTIDCTVQLFDTEKKKVLIDKKVNLGDMLITRL